MKKLELKHLAPYLPYGLKLKFVSKCSSDRISVNDIVALKEIQEGSICVNGYKTNNKSYLPILRPLSDLTKEVEHGGKKFVPYIELLRECNFNVDKMSIEEIELYKPEPTGLMAFDYESSMYCEVAKVLEWHFDIFDLIGSGLAIDINTL